MWSVSYSVEVTHSQHRSAEGTHISKASWFLMFFWKVLSCVDWEFCFWCMKFYVYIWGFVNDVLFVSCPCAALNSFFLYYKFLFEALRKAVSCFGIKRQDWICWHMKAGWHVLRIEAVVSHTDCKNNSTLLHANAIFSNDRRNVTTLFTSSYVFSSQHFTARVKLIKSNQNLHIIYHARISP